MARKQRNPARSAGQDLSNASGSFSVRQARVPDARDRRRLPDRHEIPDLDRQKKMKRAVRLELFPEGIDASLATWTVEGKSVLDWQLEFLSKQGVSEIAVADTPQARGILGASDRSVRWTKDALDGTR